MIEIIEHGDKAKSHIQPREGECDNCHCKFTYTRDDCYWYGTLMSFILRCPECGKDVWLGDVFDD